MANNVVLLGGAGSRLGVHLARELADRGEVTYAGVCDAAGRNRDRAEEISSYADREKVELRALELDVGSEQSVAVAVTAILDREGRIDVLVHGVDDTVPGAVHLDCAVLRCFRRQRAGLIVWLSSPGPSIALVVAGDVTRLVVLSPGRRP